MKIDEQIEFTKEELHLYLDNPDSFHMHVEALQAILESLEELKVLQQLDNNENY